MPAGHRRMFLRRLARLDECDRGLLSNARCLAESVDVPAVDAVVFVDPRESVIDIVQAVGRTMRKSPQTGKELGTIILPVVLHDEEDAESVLSPSAFATVWKVLAR
jgi:predicted helicase